MRQKRRIKKKQGRGSRLMISGLLVIFLFVFIPVQKTQAGWPTSNLLTFPGMGMEGMMDMVRIMIHDMLLSQMQKQAVKQIRNTMHQAFSGGGTNGGSMAITDYQQFIFGSAGKVGEEEIKNVFQTLSASASSAEKQVLDNIQKQVQNEIFPTIPSMNFNKLAGGANPYSSLFSGDSMDIFMEYHFGGNHPADVYLTTTKIVQSKIQQEAKSKTTKAMANLGINSNNGVPGAITAQVMATAEAASINMIANATNMQQVIANIATSAISSFVEEGFNQTAQPANDQSKQLGQGIQGGLGSFSGMGIGGGFGLSGGSSQGMPGIPSIGGFPSGF